MVEVDDVLVRNALGKPSRSSRRSGEQVVHTMLVMMSR